MCELKMISNSINRVNKYEFNKNGLNKCLKDIKKRQEGRIEDIIFYTGIIVLFLVGVIGSKFVLSYFVGSGTSKVVKWLMVR